MLKFYFYLLIILIFGTVKIYGQSILINEFLASNIHTIKDEHNEHDDWIEILNASDSTLDLNGLYISDNPDSLTKWQFKSSHDSIHIDSTFILLPGSYILLWADKQPEQGNRHLNFGLDDDGERIILSAGDTSAIYDQVNYGQQYADVSFGRDPYSMESWYYYSDPTPGSKNSGKIFTDKCEPPVIDIESGFYSNAQYVEMHAENDSYQIFYTTDCSLPTFSNSKTYTGPFQVTKSTVIRAVTHRSGLLNSKPVARSLIFEEAPELPVIFLSADSSDIWGPTGLYKLKYSNLEITANFEFFDQQTDEHYMANSGVKIHAPDSKSQQAFRIYARSAYGNEYFRYRFFESKEIDKFKRLVIRNGGNDGIQIKERSNLRDAIIQQLYFEHNKTNAMAAWRPVHVYLNDRYWGLYNLRERQDEYYIEENYPYEGEIDLLERAFGAPRNRYTLSGDWTDYLALYDFLKANDMTNEENYTYAEQQIDIDNFIQYWIFEVYVGNFDWLLNNMRFWKEKSPRGKWRWIMWDVDHGLGLPFGSYGKPDWNTLSWSTSTTGERTASGENTVFIRKLLTNITFKTKFINMFADVINSTLTPANIHRVTDEAAAKIDNDVLKQTQRWSGNNYINWQAAVQSIKDYASARDSNVKRHIMEKFSIDHTFKFTLRNDLPEAGSLKVNSLTVNDALWHGEYFDGYPAAISAVPNYGYNFDHWVKDSLKIRSDTLLIGDSTFVTAVFVPDTMPRVIVTEINYHSAESYDSGDWIELYNPIKEDIDISGWIIKDEDHEHNYVFPENTKIDSNAYLVVSEDPQKFVSFFPDVPIMSVGLGYGLGNNKDQVRIYNRTGWLVDSIAYDDDSPWPKEADGEGYTLELISTHLDNTFVENWEASKLFGGTPGMQNSVVTDTNISEDNLPKNFILYQNYPNPFNGTTRIDFALPSSQHVNISVFNSRGQLVAVLTNKRYPRGKHYIRWDSTNLSSGIYFVYARAKRSHKIIKSLLIK